MGIVVSFLDFAPGERLDGIPYTFVEIWETPPELPYDLTLIDTIQMTAIGGIDTDPSKPKLRRFSTTEGTVDTDGVYRLVWWDATGNRSLSDFIQAQHQPVFPAVPSAAEIRLRMPRVEWAEMGFPAPGPSEDDLLDPVIADSVHEFQVLTTYNPLLLSVGLPTTTLAAKAIRWMTAFNANRETQAILETTTDFDLLGSLSQGRASESRRQMTPGKNVLHPSPVINRLLQDFITAMASTVATLDHVPGVNPGLGVVPKPGQFVMDDPYRGRYDLAASVYGSVPTLGVAVYTGSG